MTSFTVPYKKINPAVCRSNAQSPDRLKPCDMEVSLWQGAIERKTCCIIEVKFILFPMHTA